MCSKNCKHESSAKLYVMHGWDIYIDVFQVADWKLEEKLNITYVSNLYM